MARSMSARRRFVSITSLTVLISCSAAVRSTGSSVVSTAAPGTESPCGRSIAKARTVEQVVWIFMENHTRAQVLGDAASPYVPALIRACATAADYREVGSPSLPNYLGATSGQTFGIDDDKPPKAHQLMTDNVFRQVRAVGRRAVSYEESMPAPCSLTDSGRYAVRHNPAAYFAEPQDRAACALDNLPLGTLERGALVDAIDTDTMAAFTFVTPDVCSDTHDCKVSVGDAWLAGWIPRLVASAAYRRGTMVIFVAWDEPSPMPFVAIAPGVLPGSSAPGSIDHYALLRVTEELLGLPLLSAAQQAPDVLALVGR